MAGCTWRLVLQGTWRGWWYEGCLAQRSCEEKCFVNPYLPWIQRYDMCMCMCMSSQSNVISLISCLSSCVLGDKQGALEFLKLIFRALCLCWDRQTQDLHVDWILFRGRSLIPVSCEVVNDNVDGYYPSSHYPIFAEFMLPRTVRLTETPTQDQS